MIFYNLINAEYIAALRDTSTVYRTMIQPLDTYENPIAEIYADLLTSEPPKLDIGSSNGIRRTFSAVLWNYDGMYNPSKNSFFWYGRKFRVLESVFTNGNEYRQSMGTFVCRDANESEGLLTIIAVDKYGLLNGELNVGRSTLPLATDISQGDIFVADLIEETLTLGRNTVLDPVRPLIEPFFRTQKLYADIALGAGQAYGEVLSALAEMYGADCYFDRFGRLRSIRRPDYNDPSRYRHMGAVWTFTDADVSILQGAVRSTSFRAVNTVVISTDNTDGEITTVTVRNVDPSSPISVPNIGEQLPDEPTVYISVGDTTRETAEEKCRQYGAYILLKNAAQQCSIAFETALIPHLDVDELINYKGEDMLVTQISADLSTKIMQISACSVAELPKIEVK